MSKIIEDNYKPFFNKTKRKAFIVEPICDGINLFPGIKIKGGATKLRGKKKDKNNDISLTGSVDSGRFTTFSEKEGYEEEQKLREEYMKNNVMK